MASDAAGSEASAAVGSDVRAEVGALPDIGRREAGGWLVPVAASIAITHSIEPSLVFVTRVEFEFRHIQCKALKKQSFFEN